MKCWAVFLHKNMYYVGFTGLIISLYCILHSIFIIKTPDFSNPDLGFETRGTIIAQRLTAWRNILKQLEPSGSLSSFPKLKFFRHKHDNTLNHNRITRNIQNVSKSINFCGSPVQGYSRIIVKSKNEGADLLTFENILNLCHLESEIMSILIEFNICEVQQNNYNFCCFPWSLANYIAMENNRSSCSMIQESDVTNFIEMIKKCEPYFHNEQLKPDCFEEDICDDVPDECYQSNNMYNVFYYLMDTNYFESNLANNLKITSIVLPIAQSTAILSFYNQFASKGWSYNQLEIVAADFGLKDTLFDLYLLKDLQWVIGGCIVVLICVWFYTSSMFITVTVVFMILTSLGVAYCLYTEIFHIDFFPFMNILAVIISVGIGADDVFIYYKYWNQSENLKKSTKVRLIDTLEHSLAAIFLTSFTTALSFYMSMFSSITAIRCFSVFAGTIVIVNFLIIVTWFPALTILSEKWKLNISSKLIIYMCERKNCSSKLKFWCKYFTEYFVNTFVIQLRWFWFLSLNALAFCAIVTVWYYPKFNLPNTREFQLFQTKHVFEQYDLHYKNHFRSEQFELNSYKMPIRFVWGVKPIDNGNYMNPYSRGSLVFDKNFDISHKKSQKWLLQFCRKIKHEQFYLFQSGPQLLNCFIENFEKWMRKRCINKIENIDYSPCCNETKFPYKRPIFKQCIQIYMQELYQTPKKYLTTTTPGLKFNKRGTIKVLILEFTANVSYSFAYDNMHEFYQTVEKWFKRELILSAPEQLLGGWFISDFDFYDLQNTLANDTYNAIFYSLLVAFIILFLITRNIFICILTVITISHTIHVIISILILFNWHLNVLESIVLSSSIGLTVDFSLHYGTKFLKQKQVSAKECLIEMIGPTSMTCLTTASAGLFMLQSEILGYIQIGVFLLVAMGVSWIYSTFYFGTVLAIFELDMCKRVYRSKDLVELDLLIKKVIGSQQAVRSKSLPVLSEEIDKNQLRRIRSLPNEL